MVAAERERARAEREAEEELARQASVIDELSTDFAGYISNITFADVEVPGYELDVDSDPVTASVTLPLNFTAEDGRRFIEDTVMESIESARDTDTGPVINFVHERTAGGHIIRFYAEEGIDIDGFRASIDTLTAANISMIAPNVSRVTQLLEVEGGRIITIGEDSRAILYRDGGADTWIQDMLAAMQAGQAAQAQAAVFHGMSSNRGSR